jgi:hypothetical protein
MTPRAGERQSTPGITFKSRLMFDEKSRYFKTEQYQLPDRRGRMVPVMAVPAAPQQNILGYHVWKQGQRPDHLSAKYLGDPAGFWRIGEANDAMLAEALSEQTEIAIPQKTR